MARAEQDREDILREATALVERIQVTVPGCPEPVVAGFRRDGSASFYFGADPVVQFNTSRHMRRGYDQGRLLKAEKGAWIAMHRVRLADKLELVSRPLSPLESREFQQRVGRLLTAVLESLRAGTARIEGQVPADRDVAGRVYEWLQSQGNDLPIANQPHVGG